MYASAVLTHKFCSADWLMRVQLRSGPYNRHYVNKYSSSVPLHVPSYQAYASFSRILPPPQISMARLGLILSTKPTVRQRQKASDDIVCKYLSRLCSHSPHSFAVRNAKIRRASEWRKRQSHLPSSSSAAPASSLPSITQLQVTPSTASFTSPSPPRVVLDARG